MANPRPKRKLKQCRDCNRQNIQVSAHCSQCGGIMCVVKPPVFRR